MDIGALHAAALAERLGGPDGAQHLRFTLTSPEGDLGGGYSIAVG
ncbi:hypothetical protein [Streptomyces sp. ISL-36]|nr:hypothetical protein [Streptomyces sp. ISL-36]